MCRLQTWLSSRHKPSVGRSQHITGNDTYSHGPSSALNLNFPAPNRRRRELHGTPATHVQSQAKRSLGGEERRMIDVKARNSWVPVEYQPPAPQLLSQLHEIDDMNAPPAVFNAPCRELQWRRPDPAASLTTKPGYCPNCQNRHTSTAIVGRSARDRQWVGTYPFAEE